MTSFRILLAAMLFAVGCLQAGAQRKIKVLDFDTNLPIADVSVRIDSLPARRTNYLGEVEVGASADSISFSHLKYQRERLALTELTDTMYLFPQDFMLKEVVVTAYSPDLLRSMRAYKYKNLNQRPGSLLTFDLGLMLDRRGRRDRKHLRRAHEILREFDQKLCP